jgi:hypothetical protein
VAPSELRSNVVPDELESRCLFSALPIDPPAFVRVTRQTPEVPVPAHRRDLVPTGRNRFFVLDPGFTTVFAGNEDGAHKRLTITVTPKTRVIDGVRTRVIIERQTSNGHLEEISENYYARDRKTGNVFYFGEDVNIYNHGVVVSHESAWRSGVDGAKFGLIMPADTPVGTTFLQEQAPGVAQDQAEVVQTGIRAHTAAGTFKGAFKTRETTVLEPDEVEFKLYAPGVGLVQDDTLTLVSHSALPDD